MKIFKLWFLIFNFTFLISSALAAERAERSGASPKGTPKEIEIASNISQKRIPQGSNHPVKISIKNNSQNPIIPLRFWAEYAGGEAIDGSIESFARFHTKTLFPNETIVFEKEMRFLKTGRANINLGLLYLKGDAEETATSSASAEIEPLSLSLEGAFKKVGFATSVYTFSFWKNGWVLEKEKSLYIVNSQGVKAYPKVSIDIFKFIESSSDGVYFMTYNAKAFEKIRHIFSRYNLKEGKTITVRVPKDAALDICEYLNNLKFEVSLSRFNLTQAIEMREIKR